MFLTSKDYYRNSFNKSQIKQRIKQMLPRQFYPKTPSRNYRLYSQQKKRGRSQQKEISIAINKTFHFRIKNKSPAINKIESCSLSKKQKKQFSYEKNYQQFDSYENHHTEPCKRILTQKKGHNNLPMNIPLQMTCLGKQAHLIDKSSDFYKLQLKKLVFSHGFDKKNPTKSKINWLRHDKNQEKTKFRLFKQHTHVSSKKQIPKMKKTKEEKIGSWFNLKGWQTIEAVEDWID